MSAQPDPMDYYIEITRLHHLYWQFNCVDLSVKHMEWQNGVNHPLYLEYRERSQELMQRYPNAQCCKVNPMMWDDFVERYQRVNGRLPSRRLTPAQTLEQILLVNDTELVDAKIDMY